MTKYPVQLREIAPGIMRKVYGRDPLSKKRTQLKRNYGLSVEDNETIKHFQEGKCAICLRPLPIPNVDHSHATGESRGHLCWHCNNALGKFRDDPEMMVRAADYLRNPPVVKALGGPRFGLPGRTTTSMKRRKMLAKKNLEAGRVPQNAYDFCCPELKDELKAMIRTRAWKDKKTNEL